MHQISEIPGAFASLPAPEIWGPFENQEHERLMALLGAGEVPSMHPAHIFAKNIPDLVTNEGPWDFMPADLVQPLPVSGGDVGMPAHGSVSQPQCAAAAEPSLPSQTYEMAPVAQYGSLSPSHAHEMAVTASFVPEAAYMGQHLAIPQMQPTVPAGLPHPAASLDFVAPAPAALAVQQTTSLPVHEVVERTGPGSRTGKTPTISVLYRKVYKRWNQALNRAIDLEVSDPDGKKGRYKQRKAELRAEGLPRELAVLGHTADEFIAACERSFETKKAAMRDRGELPPAKQTGGVDKEVRKKKHGRTKALRAQKQQQQQAQAQFGGPSAAAAAPAIYPTPWGMQETAQSTPQGSDLPSSSFNFGTPAPVMADEPQVVGGETGPAAVDTPASGVMLEGTLYVPYAPAVFSF